MFKNIGGKIKILSVVIFCLQSFIYILAGIILVATAFEMELEVYLILGVLCIIIGPVLAWVSSFVLYGYGELITKTCGIEKILKNANKENITEA